MADIATDGMSFADTRVAEQLDQPHRAEIAPGVPGRKLRHKRPLRRMVDGEYRVTAMWDGTLRGTVTRAVTVRDGVAYDHFGDEYELILQSWLRDCHIPTTVVPEGTPGAAR